MKHTLYSMASLARKIAITLFVILSISACSGGGGDDNGGSNQSGDTAVTWDHSNWDEKNWQ